MDDCQAGEASDDESVASSSEQSESYIQFTEARNKVCATIAEGLGEGEAEEQLVLNVLKAGHLPPPLTADELLAQQNWVVGMIEFCKDVGQEF